MCGSRTWSGLNQFLEDDKRDDKADEIAFSVALMKSTMLQNQLALHLGKISEKQIHNRIGLSRQFMAS